MEQADLSKPADADFHGVVDIGDMAQREGFDSSTAYAGRFALALCGGESLDVLRERFTALTGTAGLLSPDNAAGGEIGRHYIILDALFRRLIIDSRKVADAGGRGSSEAAERLMNGAFKAQRAALACLSALKVLRESNQPQPPTTPKAGFPLLSASGPSN